MTRVTKCDKDAFITGTCAGISKYFDFDVTLLRFMWFISIFFFGFGVVFYILLSIFLPNEND